MSGFEIEDFEKAFLPRHPAAASLWQRPGDTAASHVLIRVLLDEIAALTADG